MASNTTRAHIAITMDGKHAKNVISALKSQAEALNAEIEKLKAEGKDDTTDFRQKVNEWKSVTKAIKENEKMYIDLDAVIQNLAGTTKKNLSAALKSAVRDMQDMAESSDRLEKVKGQYNAIMGQLKKLGVEYVNVGQVMRNLDSTSEKTLRTVLSQLREQQTATGRGTQAWIKQEQQIKQLEKTLDNLHRMDPNLVMGNLSGASSNDIKDAIAQMEKMRDSVVMGSQQWDGYNAKIKQARDYMAQLSDQQQKMTVDTAKSMASGQQPATVGQLKEAATSLREFRDSLDATDDAGLKEVDTALQSISDRLSTVKKETLDVTAILGDPKSFSPEKIKMAIAELNKQLDRMTINDPARDGVKKQILALNAAIDETALSAAEMKKITDNIKSSPVEKLKQAAKQLESEMEGLERTSKDYVDKYAEFSKIKRELDDVNKGWKEQSNTIQEVFKRLTAYVGIYGVYNVVKNKLTEIVNMNIEFSDSLADIRKTTGLSATEVDRLSDSINKISTRTSRDELHQLAYEAGRLGLGKYGAEGILGFAKAADQLSVALKEDLGDDAIVQLVKMADVMGVIPKLGVEKSLLAIGSSINALSQSTTAKGDYITDYSRRLSGIARQAHLSTAELFGFAAASDATGQEVEVAATAMSKFATRLQTHYKTVAAAAGVNADALHGLLEQGKTAEAIVMVLEALKDKGGLSLLAPLMKDLGSDGERLSASLSNLATNVDKVKESIEISKQAFGEATSVTSEYNIKNETAAAILEKMKNSWDKLFTNQTNVGVIKELAQDVADLSTKLQTNKLLIAEVKIVIFLLINALKALVALLPYLTVFLSIKGWIALSMAIKGSVIPAIGSLIGSLGKMFTTMTATTAGVNGLARAWKILNTVLRSNVFIAVASVIATIVFSLVSMKKKLDDVTVSANNLDDSLKNYNKTSNAAAIEANQLFSRLKNTAKGTKEHSDAINAVNTQYAKYLPFLITEKTKLEDIEKAQWKVNDELRKSMALKAKNSAMDEVGTQYTNKMADNLSNIQETYNRAGIRKLGELDINYITEAAAKYKEAGQGFSDIVNSVWKDLYYKGGKSFELVKHGGLLSNEWNYLKENLTGYIANYWNQQVALKNVQKKYDPLIGDYQEKPEETDAPYTIVEDEKDSERKKREQEALKAARGKYQAAMSAIEVFYKQQQQVVKQSYTDRKITSERMEQELDVIELKHLQTRLEARKKLHGDANTWESELTSLPQFDMAKNSNSQQAIANLMEKDLKSIGEELRKYGEKEDDGIWSKLEEDKLKMLQVAIDHRKEVEKVLLEFDYTGKVTRQYQSQLEKLKVFFVNYADATRLGYTDVEQVASAGMNKLLKLSPDLYNIDINTSGGLKQFKNMIIDAEEFGVEMLNMADDDYKTLYYKTIEYADAITEAQKKARDRQLKIAKERYKRTDDYKDGEKTSAKDKSTVDVYNSAKGVGLATESMVQDQEVLMYQHRLEAATDYYNYLRENGYSTEEQMIKVQEASAELSSKLVEQVKNRLDNLKNYTDAVAEFGVEFGASALVKGEEGLEGRQKALENMVRSFGEATNKIIMDWVKQKIEHAILRKSMMDTEEEYKDEMNDVDTKSGMKVEKAEKKMARAAAKRARDFISEKLSIKKEGVKEEEGIEEQSQSVQEKIATDGAGAVGKALIGIGQQTVAAKKVQAAENVGTSATETAAEVPLGIAGGAAKTIGQLGWWGIPLVAVISALLGGLLSMAMSGVSSLFGGSEADGAGASTSQTKLVTGMLTYDSGNVQKFSGAIDGKSYPVLGNDGQVYQATKAKELQTGLVSSPIATMVNGQPSLVAEKGPEIVIGSKTTRAMMMYRPDMLADLVKFDKNRSGSAYRTYDKGNISEYSSYGGGVGSEQISPVLTEAISSIISKELSPALSNIAQSISASTSVNAALADQLSRGIRASINKNGKGGLIDEVADGFSFAMKNGTNDKLRRLFGK